MRPILPSIGETIRVWRRSSSASASAAFAASRLASSSSFAARAASKSARGGYFLFGKFPLAVECERRQLQFRFRLGDLRRLVAHLCDKTCIVEAVQYWIIPGFGNGYRTLARPLAVFIDFSVAGDSDHMPSSGQKLELHLQVAVLLLDHHHLHASLIFFHSVRRCFATRISTRITAKPRFSKRTCQWSVPRRFGSPPTKHLESFMTTPQKSVSAKR